MIHSIEVTVLGEDGREPCVREVDRTVEQLEDEITTLCAHIGATEHRFLRAVGEFDARKGWVGIGIASCAHWLNWTCGISLVAAHDKVRVARALRTLPEIGAAMGRGELSYSKVRALTRVATPENESALVRLAQQGTAAHVEEIVRRYRRVQRVDETAGAATKQRERELRYRWDDDGTLVIHARLPAEQGALVIQAIEAAAESLRRAARGDDAPHSSAEECTVSAVNSSAEDSPAASSPLVAEVLTSSPYLPDESFAARRADALALMAETLRAHGASELSPSERHHRTLGRRRRDQARQPRVAMPHASPARA